MFDPTIKQNNEILLNSFASKDAGIQKTASAGVEDYLRVRAREDGLARKVQPPISVTTSDLDRQHNTIKPVIVKDMEPDTAGAYSVPFANVPMDEYMGAPRYRIMFDRIMSYRYKADIMNLLTYDMDIKEVYNDLLLKDILAEEDRKYFGVADIICGTVPDVNNTPRFKEVGARGFTSVGVFDRVSIKNALKGLPSTNRHLNASKAVLNNITMLDMLGLGRDGIGGDLSEELFINGISNPKYMGLQWVVTIKTDIVLNDIMYMFAAPKYLGDFFTLEDLTVSTKTENYLIEMFAYESIGATIKNSAAVAKAEFKGVFTTWNG